MASTFTPQYESMMARQAREARENARMTVRCDCGEYTYTGRAATAVRRMAAHRAQHHPDRPSVTPRRLQQVQRCKADGCTARRLSGGGRYAGLCSTHKAAAIEQRATEREAERAQRAAARDRAGLRVQRPQGAGPRTHCRVPGCTAPYVASRGRYAYLCTAHRPQVAAAAPAPPPVGALDDPARQELVCRLYAGGIWIVGIAAAAEAAGWGGAGNISTLIGQAVRARGYTTSRGGGNYRIPDYNAAEVAAMFQALSSGA